MEIVKNPLSAIPSYERWTKFLELQNPSQVTMSLRNIDRYAESLTSIFWTDVCENRIEYFNRRYPDGLDLKPRHLSQKSRNIRNGTANTTVHHEFLGADLNLQIDNAKIFSLAMETSSVKNYFRSWQQVQKIFLRLTDNYFHELKSRFGLPDWTDSGVHIVKQDNKIRFGIENKRKKTEHYRVQEDYIRQIQADTGFGFDIDRSGQIICHLPNLTCTVEPAKIQKVDEDSVWRAITGTNRLNSFLFPIIVTS